MQIHAELAAAGAEGYNIGWNCGEVAGQTVGHAHCHLIPRRSGDLAVARDVEVGIDLLQVDAAPSVYGPREGTRRPRNPRQTQCHPAHHIG